MKIFKDIKCYIACILSLFYYVKCQDNFVKVKFDKFDKFDKRIIFVVHLKYAHFVPKIDLESGGTIYLQNLSKLCNLKCVKKYIKNKVR